MNKHFIVLTTAIVGVMVVFSACEKKPAKPKTVSVSAQSGVLAANVAGEVTFAVTTENIADGAYQAAVANMPVGVSVKEQVAISAGRGTLTLATTADAAHGEYNTLILTLDGATSNAFTLTIAEPAVATPAAPAYFKAEVGDANVILTWKTPAVGSSPVTGYQASASATAGYESDWKSIEGATAATTSHIIAGLDNGVEYTVEVRAVNAAGAGASSERLRVTPVTGGNVPTITITLTPNPITMSVGQTRKFDVTVFPENATNKAVTWETSSGAISIDATGNITGNSATTGATVIARSVSNTAVTGTATVSVVEYATEFPVDGIYYKAVGGRPGEVMVTNKEYSDNLSATSLNSYSGNVSVPATVTRDGLLYHVTEVGMRAFYEQESVAPLISVALPASIVNILAEAFSGCASLTAVNLPEGLENINAGAFTECKNLAALHLPASLSGLADGNPVFSGCEKLSITVAAENMAFETCAAGALYGGVRSGNLTLRWIPEKMTGTYTIPTGIVNIYCAATDRSNLSEIRIPASVTLVNSNNFRSCASLTSIWLNWTTPPPSITPSFSDTDRNKITLYVPKGTLNAYATHPTWRNFKCEEQP